MPAFFCSDLYLCAHYEAFMLLGYVGHVVGRAVFELTVEGI